MIILQQRRNITHAKKGERQFFFSDISRLSSELDALLSLSIVALERDWIRPNLFDKFPPQPIDIKAGRHPLQGNRPGRFTELD